MRLLASTKLGQDVDGAAENELLLLSRELGYVLVSVAVEGEFMAGVTDFRELTRETLDAVGWSEEGGFDGVLGVKSEQTIDAYCCPINAARNVRGILGRAITSVDLQ